MTFHKDVWITCDGEGENCEIQYGTQVIFTTASKVRDSAKGEGWVYRMGNDYCPECK